ncbi:hypothetical protein LEP1GSC067_3826 [Leptospira interrogans serovar Lora str. TE 1992]|uniref:Uncharacterized protein n=1 Tax=Leptospira interrogans serovar Lora str. TE 1992 TaxID=1193028 RepID=M3EW45_LEPIR|nr:hypothetical protein LEP1GSC067_3826 [Leptospira interrogans serovar Lora str. TE 1992]
MKQVLIKNRGPEFLRKFYLFFENFYKILKRSYTIVLL